MTNDERITIAELFRETQKEVAELRKEIAQLNGMLAASILQAQTSIGKVEAQQKTLEERLNGFERYMSGAYYILGVLVVGLISAALYIAQFYLTRF